ncbi:MAG: MBL fold metallo-hydrolase [Propionibacteriaceae bacterium]|nr:MBL fold metallo-hydrolase [Propionibacteriaceae bacterium]
MRITHLGHAAVLVETKQSRILIDPGNLSDGWHGATDLDAVLITHVHPDHLDPQHVPQLLAANPSAKVFTESSVPDLLAAGDVDLGSLHPVSAGDEVKIGDVIVSAVGGVHAEIHRDIPRIGNVGLVLRCEGEPTLFHPGDSYATAPGGVDIVAVPAYGPWAALKETIDFVRAVGALEGFPIHDELLNERGRGLVSARINELTSTRLVDLRGGVTHQF